MNSTCKRFSNVKAASIVSDLKKRFQFNAFNIQKKSLQLNVTELIMVLEVECKGHFNSHDFSISSLL